jgi:periplasmic protein TonB
MSAAALTSFRAPILAWDVATEDDARFNRIVRTVLVVCTLLCLGVLIAPVVKEDRSQPQELPPRLAKMLLERAPPPPPLVKPEKPKDALKDAAPDTAVEAPTKPVAAVKLPEPTRKVLPVPEARQPLPDKAPGEIDAARRKAAGVGLLAMASELAEIRGAPAAVQLRTDIKQGPGVGTGSGPGVGAGSDAGVPVRSLLTSNATGGSGGINTAGYSRDTGGGGLAGRATTLVEGVAGGGGGGGAGGGGSRARAGDGVGKGANAGGTVQRGNSGKASRSTEEIKLVFDRNKGAIYAIYNRALREDPGLQGKVVLELTIAPSGAVSECRIVSSDLKSPELEAKLLARIRQFDFGAKDVDLMIAKFPVDFLPS